MEKLAALVAGPARSPPAGGRDPGQQLAKVKGGYRVFKPEDYRKGQGHDEQIKKYYQDHQAAYMVPATVSFDYLVFPLSAQRDQCRSATATWPMPTPRTATATPARAGRGQPHPDQAAREASPARSRRPRRRRRRSWPWPRSRGPISPPGQEVLPGPLRPPGRQLGKFGRGTKVAPFGELAFKLKPGEIRLVRTHSAGT